MFCHIQIIKVNFVAYLLTVLISARRMLSEMSPYITFNFAERNDQHE